LCPILGFLFPSFQSRRHFLKYLVKPKIIAWFNYANAVKNIAEVETGFKAWLSGFQIPDVTIQSVSVEKGSGPKELELKTKFSISSAKVSGTCHLGK
jgi:hypothetical protein